MSDGHDPARPFDDQPQTPGGNGDSPSASSPDGLTPDGLTPDGLSQEATSQDGLQSLTDDTYEVKFLKAVANAGVYHVDAYAFLQEGLEFTVRRAHGVRKEDQTHVSGQQLCEGLRDLALQKYGLLASTVLERWNVTSTIDFGHMVYALINVGLLAKTEQDSLEDFRNVFDLRRSLGGVGGAHGKAESAKAS